MAEAVGECSSLIEGKDHESQPNDEHFSDQGENLESVNENVYLDEDNAQKSSSDIDKSDISTGKMVKFPLSRVKLIAKTVPSLNLISNESLALISKAAELFISYLSKACLDMATLERKKIVTRNHLNSVVEFSPQFEFLDGMLD